MSVFWKSKHIPEPYRKWFDSQFSKILNSKPDIANGLDPKAAIEDMVEDFKKTQEKEKIEEDKK